MKEQKKGFQMCTKSICKYENTLHLHRIKSKQQVSSQQMTDRTWQGGRRIIIGLEGYPRLSYKYNTNTENNTTKYYPHYIHIHKNWLQFIYKIIRGGGGGV